jgi:uncharacterized membrane protein YphA (DoxX/SURF4 family)
MNTTNNLNTANLTIFKYARAKNIALWILQILTAAAFLMAGFAKLSGNPMMINVFAEIGLGQWFRLLTGLIEISAAVMLLILRLIPVGAFLLACTMVGAIIAHLFIIGGSPLAPIVLLLFNVIIFGGRRARLAEVARYFSIT